MSVLLAVFQNTRIGVEYPRVGHRIVTGRFLHFSYSVKGPLFRFQQIC